MNCIYRIVWNAAIGKWVVASELASARRRSRMRVSLAAVALALASPAILAQEISQVLCEAPLELQDGACVRPVGLDGITPMAATDDGLFVVNAGTNATAASTNGVNMIAIGSNAIARPAGNGANNGALSLGANALAAGTNALSIGYGAVSDSQNGSGTSGATSLGASTRTTWNATAIGFQANGNGTVVTALGAAAVATGERGIALGRSASATGQYSSAIGAGARATHQNSVALGAVSVSRANATFAIGSATLRRGIENVADGTQANDAVTVEQLQGLLQATGGSMDGAGSVIAPGYDLANGGLQTTVGGALTELDGGVSTLTTEVNALDTQIRQGRIGLVQQSAAGADLTVAADRDGAAVRFTGSNGARRLAGVADGVDAGDAITLAQRDASVGSAAAALGGGAGVEADGSVRAPVYTVVGSDVRSVGAALGLLDAADAGHRAELVDLGDAVGEAQRYFQASASATDAMADASGQGSTALGSDAVAGGQRSLAIGAGARATLTDTVAIGAGADANGMNSVALGAGSVAGRAQVVALGGGSVGNRQLVNVTSGTQSADAVIQRQLRAVVDALGGGATIDAVTGEVTGPQYSIQGTTHQDVGAALSAMDGELTSLDARSTVNEDDVLDVRQIVSDWNGGTAGLVQQVDPAAQVSVGAGTGGTVVDVAGTDGVRQLKNVAAASDASDAINVAQMQDSLADAQPEDSRYLKVDGRLDGSDDAAGSGVGSIAVGASTRADGEAAMVLGQGGLAAADGAVALGAGSVADRANAVSIGRDGAERQIAHVADASDDTDAINLRQLKAAGLAGDGGEMMEAVGYLAGSDHAQVAFTGAAGTVLANVGDGRVQLGSREAINGGQLASFGDALGSQLDGLDGRVGALEGQPGGGGGAGDPPYYDAGSNTAIVATGAAAEATGQGAVAAGSGAQATADNSVALGSDALADRDDSVSIGHAGGERLIAHVAAGSADTDAVNLAQLQEQMASVDRYTDQRVEAMEQAIGAQMGHMSRQINRGIAASAALVQVAPNLPGKITLNAGMATYRGESAFALGLSRWSRSGRFNLHGGVSLAKGDQPLINIGFGVAFD
ncbi:YadA-like family protein [Stenotrophomonas maltophilia]|uniref:YadA-like family protein n=1 Tax=Stenotrophomonas maltophilia TaxID=40324 RepID=UPI0039C3FD46